MKSENEVRPYHAPKTSGQEAADAVAEVLKHAAEREEAAQQKEPRKAHPKWMLPLGINLGVFAVYLLIAPPAWIIVDPIEGPPEAERVEGMRRAIFLQAQRIEQYRIENGELPLSLEDAGSPIPGVEYTVQGPALYTLVGAVGDETVTYDSTQSIIEWVGGAADKLMGG